MNNLDYFIEYLKEQIGEPYVWGGQHTRLTPNTYVSIIEKKEHDKGGYAGGPSYAEAAIDFCKEKFEQGASVLYAYDCSGLGCYWLYNLKHLYRGDVNANTMMNRCDLKNDLPKKGWWVFRLNGKRASHIGYMIDDKYLIEAKGRKYGVVKTEFKTKDWHCWGVPNVFKDCIEDDAHDHKYVKMIKVKGSVRVREGNGKGYKQIPPTAKNCLLPYVGQSNEDPYWYETVWQDQKGFISSVKKYTEIVEIKE